MKTDQEVNSAAYWDMRFRTNWDTFSGPSQSRFFARLAVECFPDWLSTAIHRADLSLCDWGCAQGDGTDVLASVFGLDQVTGVDFSSAAIEKAKAAYPNLRFLAEDWLARPAQMQTFDVVFTSNTLEHFERPFEVLPVLATRAKAAVVVMVPFREFNRIPEHFSSFHEGNLPIAVGEECSLVWSKVVNCTSLPDTHWTGEQIVLVYVKRSFLKSMRLVLSDSKLLVEDESKRSAEMVRLADANHKHLRMIDALRASQTALYGANARQKAEIVKLQAELAALQAGQSADGVERGNKAPVKSPSSRLLSSPIKAVSKGARLLASSRKARTVFNRLPPAWKTEIRKIRYAAQSTRATARTENVEWLRFVEGGDQVVVVPCAFEFNELVNQRPINAAKYFASKGYRVVFVAWQWSPEDRLAQSGTLVWDNVYQVSLYDFLANVANVAGRKRDSIFYLTLPAPIFRDAALELRQKGFYLLYDIMDEWEEFCKVGQAPWYKRAVEEAFILSADKVYAVAPSLVSKFSAVRRDIEVSGNGYSPVVVGPQYRNIARGEQSGKVGYFGHLTDSWFDWRSVLNLARKNPDLPIEIIGYGEPDWAAEEASLLPNINLVGKVPPSELHTYVASWSVGIIPFTRSKLSEAVDPIKIYEYLYFGIPAVVLGIEHIARYPMTYVTTPSKFSEAVATASQAAWKIDEVDDFLNSSTWDARFDKIREDLNGSTIGQLYEP